MDDFKDKVHLVNGRYKVSLPWKDPYQSLPDHYQLSVRRLRGLL